MLTFISNVINALDARGKKNHSKINIIKQNT